MDVADVLVDGFGRVRGTVHHVLDGITPEQLVHRPGPAGSPGNSVAWLVWHLTRVQDDHVADAFGGEQVWTGHGWAERFALPLSPHDTGFRHTPEEVGAVAASAELLQGYYDAVHDVTVRHLHMLRAADLDGVVDRSWDPPVTLAVRLVSILSDDLQHAGQAAYVRGIAPA